MQSDCDNPEENPGLPNRRSQAEEEPDAERVGAFGILKDKPIDGLAYQRKLRNEWQTSMDSFDPNTVIE